MTATDGPEEAMNETTKRLAAALDNLWAAHDRLVGAFRMNPMPHRSKRIRKATNHVAAAINQLHHDDLEMRLP